MGCFIAIKREVQNMGLKIGKQSLISQSESIPQAENAAQNLSNQSTQKKIQTGIASSSDSYEVNRYFAARQRADELAAVSNQLKDLMNDIGDLRKEEQGKQDDVEQTEDDQSNLQRSINKTASSLHDLYKDIL
jgi:signal transduction histidine kinase